MDKRRLNVARVRVWMGMMKRSVEWEGRQKKVWKEKETARTEKRSKKSRSKKKKKKEKRVVCPATIAEGGQ